MSDGGCGIVDVLRGPKVADMPIFDWAGSLLAAFLIGKYVLGIRNILTWIAWILVWTAFGIIVHYILGVRTMLGYYLGINARPARKECMSMIE